MADQKEQIERCNLTIDTERGLSDDEQAVHAADQLSLFAPAPLELREGKFVERLEQAVHVIDIDAISYFDLVKMNDDGHIVGQRIIMRPSADSVVDALARIPKRKLAAFCNQFGLKTGGNADQQRGRLRKAFAKKGWV